MKEVQTEDSPIVESYLKAGAIPLVRGNVAITNELLVSSGNAIVGFNRDIDKLSYSGSTNLITVVDNDFSMRNIGLCGSL